MIIEVTIDHIRRGTPCDSTSCPIALAAQEAGLVNVDVDTAGMAWTDPSNGESRFLPLDPTMRAFIAWFDLGPLITSKEWNLAVEPVRIAIDE